MSLGAKRHCVDSLNGKQDSTLNPPGKGEKALMTKRIFVNPPVGDRTASSAFYAALGAALNPQFSGEQASCRGCMGLSDALFVMLRTR